tara:strand:- start:1066 stop:2361 length:1296 start_codon:yes stop_codon:yes gene_type:complete
MEIQEKTVNLLYTSWSDENTPIANGYDIDYSEICGSPHYFDFQGFIDVYLNNNTLVSDNRKVKINKCKIEDIKDDEIYFYVICHANLTLKELVEHKFPVHNEIINLLKTKNNINVVFCKEHEPECRFGIEKLSDEIKKLNLDEDRFYVLNNNLNTKKQIQNISSNINSHKLNFIEYSSTEVLSNLKHKMIYDREYIFLCRNKKPKFHRLCTLLYLHYNAIVENTNWSLITSDEMDRKSNIHFLKLFNIDEFNKMTSSAKFINSVFKYDVYENPKWFDENGDFQHQEDFDSVFLIPEEVKSFKNAYINIITESNFESIENIVHPTEKSFRPFFHYQIPIFVSTPNHVKYIKEKYGFDMFDDLVDHSYDSIKDDKDRFKFVMNEIKKLNQNPHSFYYQYFRKNKHRFENNKKILLDKFKENRILDLDYFWNLI